MRSHSIALFGAAWLLQSSAKANEVDRLITLGFTDRNSQKIQAMVSHPDTCSALLKTAIADHAARSRTPDTEPMAGLRVIDGCRVVSLDHDGRLQLVSTVELEGGDGPLSYVAVYKRSGLLDEADIPLGEGSGALGPVKLSLEDINHDGHLKPVETSRVANVDGHMVANVDPAPTVTHVYVWRNNAFVRATDKFRNYIASEVLPDLQKQWTNARLKPVASPKRDKEIRALQVSIEFANRLLITGHYFPGSSND